MKELLDFMGAALPWLIMGVTLAVAFANRAKERDTGCYCFEGMCLGAAILGSFSQRIGGMGVATGMALGYTIGYLVKRKEA